ncbi:FtsP/CotA-like multicopper oxidase with cupredoxin domain [Cryobacterium sp. CAN_C3]|nr:FtsP/CotA-like multicopper oxidase with cupredoxin domain [Cryobacterium sp. CAN_C3]
MDVPAWQAVVNVAARSNVRTRFAFDDLTGKTVYRCLTLDYEDSGMIGLIEAREQSAPQPVHAWENR